PQGATRDAQLEEGQRREGTEGLLHHRTAQMRLRVGGHREELIRGERHGHLSSPRGLPRARESRWVGFLTSIKGPALRGRIGSHAKRNGPARRSRTFGSGPSCDGPWGPSANRLSSPQARWPREPPWAC